MSEKELEEIRLKRQKEKLCHKILKEILFNSMIICILYLILYLNKNTQSYNYHEHIKLTFSDYETVI